MRKSSDPPIVRRSSLDSPLERRGFEPPVSFADRVAFFRRKKRSRRSIGIIPKRPIAFRDRWFESGSLQQRVSNEPRAGERVGAHLHDGQCLCERSPDNRKARRCRSCQGIGGRPKMPSDLVDNAARSSSGSAAGHGTRRNRRSGIGETLPTRRDAFRPKQSRIHQRRCDG